MTPSDQQSGDRILCIRLSGLGDVVHALNALALLRRERPHAHVVWLVEDRFADLLKGHPQIDELIAVPRKPWDRMLRNPLRWPPLGSQAGALAMRLRRMSFDVSVDFQSSLKSAWLVLAAGAKVRVGFGRGVSREFNTLVQTRLVDVPTGGVHRIERDLALLAPLGIRPQYVAPVLPRSAEDGAAVDAALAGRLHGGPLVVIHPGTSEFAAFKRWVPERYAAVADGLIAGRGADVLVTYGPADRDVAEEVAAHMGSQGAAALAPPTGSLLQYCELLRRAALFIGSDTGPMHIASALGVPVVALFGPKDPVQTGPYCSRSIVVRGQADCAPCTRRRCSHVRCMTSITAEQVLAAALDVLDGKGECRADAGLALAVLDAAGVGRSTGVPPAQTE
jgi:lipopolysaccharide heptosyltransferase I